MIAGTYSLTEENYIKAILRLSQKGENKVSLTAISEAVNVNAASAIDMLKKLKDKNLISYDKSKGAKLTETGKRSALVIVRSHRLWEVFLVNKLEYSWDAIHEIAEQLEHVRHPELNERLDKFLGFPEYDPHGDPIPKASGKLPKIFTVTLAEVKNGTSCKVAAVKDTSSSFLQYLQKLGIGIGTPIKVIEKIEFDQSLVIAINESEATTVSQRFSESILIH